MPETESEMFWEKNRHSANQNVCKRLGNLLYLLIKYWSFAVYLNIILKEPVVAYSVCDIVHNKLQCRLQHECTTTLLEIPIASFKSWKKKIEASILLWFFLLLTTPSPHTNVLDFNFFFCLFYIQW